MLLLLSIASIFYTCFIEADFNDLIRDTKYLKNTENIVRIVEIVWRFRLWLSWASNELPEKRQSIYHVTWNKKKM